MYHLHAIPKLQPAVAMIVNVAKMTAKTVAKTVVKTALATLVARNRLL